MTARLEVTPGSSSGPTLPTRRLAAFSSVEIRPGIPPSSALRCIHLDDAGPSTNFRAQPLVAPGNQATFSWQDTARSADERLDLLLAEMTLEEKVGELGSRWVGNDAAAIGDPPTSQETGTGLEEIHSVAPTQDVFTAIGSPSLEVFGSAPVTAGDGAAELVRQQRVVLESSRLRIPALAHEECLTGFTAYGATVYPAAIVWGATFDPGLVERMAASIGRGMAALGIHQGLSPVLDVVRDYRWGRVEETLGEDPYLVAMLGAAYVRGLQSAGVLATLKHFAGYSASRGARNHGPIPMGRRELMDVILPPFETAIALADAISVMNSYSDVDWAFTGTFVSDYWGVPFLATMHRIAADFDEAGVIALAAGIDVELPDTISFGQALIEKVRRGELSVDVVDRAARRHLRQKIELGLLDPEWTPEQSVASAHAVDLDSAANRSLAREMAERSLVLLDPGTALPLLGEDRPVLRRVAVVGPCAADPRTFMGCYSHPNHVLPRYPDLGLGIEVHSALDALRDELEEVDLVHELGSEVQGEDRSGFAAARAATQEPVVPRPGSADRQVRVFGHGRRLVTPVSIRSVGRS